MTSGRDEYRTPAPLFDALNAEFHFWHDLAANVDNALCPSWSGGPCDGANCRSCGLHCKIRPVPLDAAVWCNPPYSDLGPWIDRFAHIGRYVPVVALLPLQVTSKWWHSGMIPTLHEIRIPRDRIQFIHPPDCTCNACATGTKGGNRGENVVAIWRPGNALPTPAVVWGWKWNGEA